MATKFWVKTSGKLDGPFDSMQVRELAAKGELQPTDLVSTDKQRWVQANSVKGLVFPAAESLAVEPVVDLTTESLASFLDENLAPSPSVNQSGDVPTGEFPSGPSLAGPQFPLNQRAATSYKVVTTSNQQSSGSVGFAEPGFSISRCPRCSERLCVRIKKIKWTGAGTEDFSRRVDANDRRYRAGKEQLRIYEWDWTYEAVCISCSPPGCMVDGCGRRAEVWLPHHFRIGELGTVFWKQHGLELRNDVWLCGDHVTKVRLYRFLRFGVAIAIVGALVSASALLGPLFLLWLGAAFFGAGILVTTAASVMRIQHGLTKHKQFVVEANVPSGEFFADYGFTRTANNQGDEHTHLAIPLVKALAACVVFTTGAFGIHHYRPAVPQADEVAMNEMSGQPADELPVSDLPARPASDASSATEDPASIDAEGRRDGSIGAVGIPTLPDEAATDRQDDEKTSNEGSNPLQPNENTPISTPDVTPTDGAGVGSLPGVRPAQKTATPTNNSNASDAVQEMDAFAEVKSVWRRWKLLDNDVSLDPTAVQRYRVDGIKLLRRKPLVLVRSKEGRQAVFRNAVDGRPIARPFGFTMLRKMIDVSADGSRVVEIQNGEVRIMSARNSTVQRSLAIKGARAVRFSPNGHDVAIGTPTSVIVWDSRTEDRVAELASSPNAISALGFAHDGTRLVGTTALQSVIWSIPDGRLLHEIGGGSRLILHPDGDRFLGGQSGSIYLASASNKEKTYQKNAMVFYGAGVAFSPNGKFFVAHDNDRLLIHETTSGQLIHEFPLPAKHGARGAVFSDDGTMLAVLGGSSVRVWAGPQVEIVTPSETRLP